MGGSDHRNHPALARKLASLEAMARSHPAGFPEVLVTSARSGDGIPEARASFAALLA